MGYTVLLNKDNAPLKRLSVARMQLDAGSPFLTVGTHGSEGLLYSLVGSATIYADGACLGTIGGRKAVTEHAVQCVRFPEGNQFQVSVLVSGFAADLLWVTCEPERKMGGPPRSNTPYLHVSDSWWHVVGKGTHERVVCEVPTPDSYALSCGETHNIVGGISSWPPHATTDDIERFTNGETTWEEAMVFFCEKPGIANLKGVYTGGTVVNKLMEIFNGSAHVMCLGSHSIHAAADSGISYFWGYLGSALRKEYVKFSDELNTYRK